MGTPTYVGYSGTINRNGSNNEFNIDNDDPVTLVITPDPSAPDGGDLILSTGDTNTLLTITASDGTVIALDLAGALVEYGTTGIMEDGLTHPYVIITVDGNNYMFLEDIHDPTILAINPFSNGSSNPLDGRPGTDPHPVCFVNGTLMSTPNGEVRVEDIKVGDLVTTRDHGEQRVVWVGARQMTGLMAAKHAPVRISKDAFGVGLPKCDLLVSPQHRILISDWRAELLFGQTEVLVAAKHLVNDQTVRVENGLEGFSYHHILFENHETVLSNGLPSESFHPGDMAITSLDSEARAEVLELFPELAENYAIERPLTHMPLKAFEAKALTAI